MQKINQLKIVKGREGKETVLGSKTNPLTVHEVLRQEFDAKHLPPIELRLFD